MKSPLALVGLLVLVGSAVEGIAAERIPVILDTDLGTDVDDAFALALVLASPEFDVRGVTTADGDTRTRAMIACRFLDAVGRNGVPVAAGKSEGGTVLDGQFQYGLRAAHERPVRESAVEFLYEQLQADPGNVTLVAVGPLTNVAELFETHPDSKKLLKRLVIMGGSVRVGYNAKPPIAKEWNIRRDAKAARTVFESGVPLTVAPLDATTMVKLTEPLRKRVFDTPTPLCGHLHALYTLWPHETPTLYDPVAVALAIDDSFCEIEELRLEVDDEGHTRIADGEANARVATSIDTDKFLEWYVDRVTRPLPLLRDLPESVTLRIDAADRMTFLGCPTTPAALTKAYAEADVDPEKHALRILAAEDVPTSVVQRAIAAGQEIGFERFSLQIAPPHFANPSRLIERDGLPNRVHVFEDFETDIERRWWLAGLPETKDVPPGSTRAMRAVRCRDFDRRMGDQYRLYKAVIFNPVPGPPMGPRPRLSFRYKLTGGDRVRVQIFSLSNGYHRHLTLQDVPNGEWRQATVDMTEARRPDGSGGPLSEDERIDDVQFYVDTDAELLVDDVVLYDAAAEGETRPFPERFLFTGWFDTGRQGAEWPGDFEIVLHEKPRTWDAAKSVVNAKTGEPWLRVGLRGDRPLAETVHVRFQSRQTTAAPLEVELRNASGGPSLKRTVEPPRANEWTETTLAFDVPAADAKGAVDEIVFRPGKGTELLVDDVLISVPGE